LFRRFLEVCGPIPISAANAQAHGSIEQLQFAHSPIAGRSRDRRSGTLSGLSLIVDRQYLEESRRHQLLALHDLRRNLECVPSWRFTDGSVSASLTHKRCAGIPAAN